MGCVLPEKGFLESIRTICDRENIILIFDEVMTGFRLAPGGAQEKLGVRADLVTYGKVIGGGLPVGAFGGRREIMEHIAPLGKVYQAGNVKRQPPGHDRGNHHPENIKRKSLHLCGARRKNKIPAFRPR